MNRICIIDDDANIRELLSLNIAAAGYAVTLAGNGRDGLDLIMNEPPDLILLDVMMPEIDGWEICKIVRDHSELKGMKIIMLTAKDAARDKMIGKEILKADEYITKPFDVGILLATIEKLLKVT
jgi:DNA-binding response OmpR family regulator